MICIEISSDVQHLRHLFEFLPKRLWKKDEMPGDYRKEAVEGLGSIFKLVLQEVNYAGSLSEKKQLLNENRKRKAIMTLIDSLLINLL